MQATRQCSNCKKPVNWQKVKSSGAHRSVFACVYCGGRTRRIRGRRKKDTMPAGLYNYRRKVKIANDLWRHLIYRKSPDGSCANCGTKKGLQAMHLFPKGRYPHLRFELDNGAPGCPGCHRRMTNDHELHRQFCIRYLGLEGYERLRLRSLSKAKLDMDLVILSLQREASGVY